MKKMTLFASLAIVLVAGSAFALFNDEPKVENPVLATQVYYHEGDMYVPRSAPPSGKDCLEDDDNPCRVTLNGTGLPASFSESSIPTSNPNYSVLPSTDIGSWQ